MSSNMTAISLENRLQKDTNMWHITTQIL